MIGEPNNTDRATWARKALNVFAKTTFSGSSFDELLLVDNSTEGDAYCAAQDFISDLLHLAQQLGWDAADLIRCGVGNFEEELAEAQ